MKKIMIAVHGIQLTSFRRSTSIPNKKEIGGANFSLILEGCIAINDIHIEMDGLKAPGEEKEFIRHNDAMADAKFCDYPAKHLGRGMPNHFFYEYVASGINEFLNKREYDNICNFLKERVDSLNDSEIFKPSIWKNTLRVPVHFIRIYGIKGRYGLVIANIMIGHHLLIEGLRIYPTFKSEGRIFNKEIIAEIEKLLNKKNVKENLGCYARTNTSDLNGMDELFTAIPGYKEERIPPIRFY